MTVEIENKINEIGANKIKSIIPSIITEVIENNTPYIWISTEEKFVNLYGKLSSDFSGEVRRMSIQEYKHIINDLKVNGKKDWEESEVTQLLSSLNINRWVPTYTSNNGKNWLSYKDLIYDEFSAWKYDNFPLYDHEKEEVDEELELEIDSIYENVMVNLSVELLSKKIEKKFYK
ncbi:hypothetical protein GJU40_17635 [Bacillus lacus]|uniref:Uncharacterized protein n=1 Tax=Metabacillus lacus TaxID=1983721 RepID=A0A7X2LYV0_9BACI|nr:hypothetical protein [Metabacillus lacus]MRX73955.1 hypothetical protein [Metabacillus lacus]